MGYRAGDRVVMADQESHDRFPEYCPPVGTVGEVLQVGYVSLVVRWPEGSVLRPYETAVSHNIVRPYIEPPWEDIDDLF